jgi:hypothetical protein
LRAGEGKRISRLHKMNFPAVLVLLAKTIPSPSGRRRDMGGFLKDDDLKQSQPADEVMFRSLIPTRVVSSDEFWPMPQIEKQRAVEARIKEMADEIGA